MDPAVLTLIVLGVAAFFFVTELIPLAVTAMGASIALGLLGVLTPKQVFSGLSNSTVVLFAGMFVIGAAMFQTGLAQRIGITVVHAAGTGEKRLMAAIMIVTIILSSVSSNTATVACLLPVVVQICAVARLAVSPQLMALAVAANVGGTITMIGTPPNILMSATLSASGLQPLGFFEFAWIGIPLSITGVIYIDNETEQYYRATVKAVVIATGGFGSNTMMKNDLLSDIMYNKQAQDTSAGMGMRDGSGVKMAVWAGARLEENPPTMDGRQTWLNSRPAAPSYGYPQGIFMDYTGQRFMNEFWGPIEHRGFPTFYMNRELMFALYDDTLPERLEYVACSHGSTQPSASHLASIREKMNEAYANKGTLTNIGDLSVYAGDTLEECLGYAGITDAKVIANMKKAVESYNACCAAGKDTEFGRDPKLLFPIEKGPFYLQVSAGDATIGNLMATMGALWTDSEQRVLGENWKPIPGLFATGNTVSGRFGRDYFTPLMGVSIGIAVCLGREAGLSVDRWMKDELV